MDAPREPANEGNFASLIWRHAEGSSDRRALVLPPRPGQAGAEVWTFGRLIARAEELASGLRREGFVEGDRVVVLFPLCGDLYALVLALFAAGMTAVFVDPTMGARGIARALGAAGARGIVSERALLRYRFLLPALWRIERRYSRDSSGPGLRPFSDLEGEPGPFTPLPRRPDDEALITFTSGSTGCTKGSNRTHGPLRAQHLALREHFPDAPDDVVMPAFPVVTLHDLCCGLTTVIPHPDPAAVPEQIADWGVTALCASPAFLRAALPHLAARPAASRRLRRVIAGGAPVGPALCRAVLDALPGITGSVVYGSTEAEPISGVDMEEVAASAGEGVLVGRPAAASEVALVDPDGAAPEGDAAAPGSGESLSRVPPGEIGEVVVRGPHVNVGYVGVRGAGPPPGSRNGRPWHRTGDLGRFDEGGRLWLVGRRADRVRHRGRTLHSLALESQIETLPGVERSALVAHRRRPEGELVVVPRPVAGPELHGSVVDWLRGHGLEALPVRFVDEIPMEMRHQSKIDRVRLRRRLERAGWWRPAGGA